MKKVCFSLASVCICGGLLFGADNIDEANKAYNEGNYKKAIEIYKTLCEAKEAKACANLGLIYRNAKGVNEDANLAKQYYKKACDAGDTEACSVADW